ncbi:MAG: hypothetical protein ACRC37_06895 [Lentisphaeria bacterium]
MADRKPFHYYMRVLHRDIGFFTIGLMLIYALSGIVLVYRDTNFLKQDKKIERQLDKNLSGEKVGSELRLRMFRVLEENEQIVKFKEGSYNKSTGEANYTVREFMFPFNKWASLHKVPSAQTKSIISVIAGILLSFLALSSFWMYNVKSKLFKRNIFISIAGFIVAIILTLI